LARAFTLSELLVVVAILAILAGILLPALAGAHKRSYAAACLGNLRQEGFAVGLYNADNNEQYPFSGRGRDTLPAIARSQ